MDNEDDVRFQALFQKVREKELNARGGKGGRNNQKDKNDKANNPGVAFRWVKFAVYLWAGRLGLSVFGGGIPALFALFNWQKSASSNNSRATTSLVNGSELIAEHDWLTLLKHDFQDITRFRTAYEPQLIRNVSAINKDSLQLLTHSILQTFPVQMKTQTDRYFAYFTPDRPWASYLQPPYDYITVKEFLAEQDSNKFRPYFLLDSLKQQQPTSTCSSEECKSSHHRTEQQYIYLSFPRLKPYLESFAPSLALLAKYFHPKDSDVGASLWMASENVSAIMHYDLEDNFLFQVSGTKEVVVASPEASHVVKPFSSLHPLWRQSSHPQLVSLPNLLALQEQQLEDAKLDAELKELQRKIQETQERKRLHQNHQLLSPGPDSNLETEGKNTAVQKFRPEMKFRSWKVTLHPGDILFIPAGFYHAVETGQDSVSVNAWFPSELSNTHERLSSIPLPFYSNDIAAVKVADVVQIMQHLCMLLGKEKSCLATALAERYSDDVMAPLLAHSPCPAVPSQEYCLESSLVLAAKKGANRRVANAVHANLVRAGLSEPLRIQTSVEYVEEVLLLIFGNKELTPCRVEQLLRECWY